MKPMWRIFALAGILSIGWLSPAMAVAQAPPLFHTHEVESGDLRVFPKWGGVLGRYSHERDAVNAPCTPSAFNRCYLSLWHHFLQGSKAHSLREKLDYVNTKMNLWPYVTDPVNWGVDDYWETPLQFFTKDGDCEDYAISKFMSLRQLGVPNDLMRIVVLNDRNLGLLHAVLVVLDNNRWWLLDNQISEVIPADDVQHYTPIFSLNETNWWLHTP